MSVDRVMMEIELQLTEQRARLLREKLATLPTTAPAATVEPAPIELPGRPRYISAAKVAEMLGMSVSWVYKAAEDHTLPSVRFGTRRRFLAGDIEKWAAEHQVKPAQLVAKAGGAR